MIKITTTGVFVEDQERALKFYTDILGFQIKDDIPVGEFRWITLVNKGEEDGTELLLEPNNNPTAKNYQEGLYADGIPAQMFGVEDIEQEYERLIALDVKFTMQPSSMDGFKIAVFEDTVGNLIQLLER